MLYVVCVHLSFSLRCALRSISDYATCNARSCCLVISALLMVSMILLAGYIGGRLYLALVVNLWYAWVANSSAMLLSCASHSKLFPFWCPLTCDVDHVAFNICRVCLICVCTPESDCRQKVGVSIACLWYQCICHTTTLLSQY